MGYDSCGGGFCRYNKNGDFIWTATDALYASDYIVEFEDGTKLTTWVDEKKHDLTLAQAIELTVKWGRGCARRLLSSGGGWVDPWGPSEVLYYFPEDSLGLKEDRRDINEALTREEREAPVWYHGLGPWE